MILSVFTVYGQSKKTIKLYNKAIEYFQSKDYNNAINTYLEVIEEDPRYSWPYINLGITYKEVGEYDLSIKYLNTALQMDPNNHHIYYSLGATYTKIKQYDKSNQYYHQAAHFEDANLDTIYSNMGFNFLFWGKLDSAIHYFEKSLELHPAFEAPLTNIAYLHIMKENYTEAQKCLETLIQEYPDVTNNYNNLGYVLCKLNDLDNAEKYLRQSLKMDNKNEWTYRNFGILYQAKGDQKNACKNLDKAIELGFEARYGKEVSELLQKHCEEKSK